MRALAVRWVDASDAVPAADPPGEVIRYAPDRLITECVRTGLPVMVPQVKDEDLLRIARSPEAAEILAGAGVHSYLAVPLIARGEVLGAIDLIRTRTPRPFDEDDLLLARELASRAAVQIDNARWYQNARDTALTLQRSLLPSHPSVTGGLEVASRYQPGRHQRGRRRLVRRDPAGRRPYGARRGRRDGQRHPGRRHHGTAADRHPHAGVPRPRPGGPAGTPEPDHRGAGRGDRHLCLRRPRPARAAVRDLQRRPPPAGPHPRHQAPELLDLPTGCRWALAGSPSPRPRSTWSRATASSSTPTAWWRPAATPGRPPRPPPQPPRHPGPFPGRGLRTPPAHAARAGQLRRRRAADRAGEGDGGLRRPRRHRRVPITTRAGRSSQIARRRRGLPR